ncbi:discoidin domain-containing protein [Lactococcus formosensis]|uniref:discoidin domain-containing protein n=1 Tax=Lactococcus formosensis TaxID=1281486 RepID=UPI001BCD0CD2|nr:discoidin domain-containing protein [Lactococcus formosensis]
MIKIELLNVQDELVISKFDNKKEELPVSKYGTELCALGIKDYVYELGDKIRVTVDRFPDYYMVQLDESLAPSLVYFTVKEWIFDIPLAENLKASGPSTAFQAVRRHLMVRKAYDFEVRNYQNLSNNTHDQKQSSGVFPHASANVETRDESVFFAKNAIDGKLANGSHGRYPFASWGINQQADAALTVEFGREVEVDKITLLLRADFPHDSYWTDVEIVFSNNENIEFKIIKSDQFQVYEFPPVRTCTITLRNLKKALDDSPFPALTQLEIYGKNIVD